MTAHKFINDIIHLMYNEWCFEVKRKEYTIPLTASDALDVKMGIERNEVKVFSLNYRTKIDGNYFEVYRVDTAHGYLHEQRYWLTPEPIPIPSLGGDLNEVFNFYLDHIKNNFERFRKYYLERMKLR